MAAQERRSAWRLVLPAMLWTLAFFVIPFAAMVAMSLWQRSGTELVRAWHLQNYASFFAKPYFVEGLVNSLEITVVVTVVSAVLAYPMAWFIASYFLSVTFSWDEFIIAFLLSRFDVTLPVEIWSLQRSGFDPKTNIVGSIVFLTPVAAVKEPRRRTGIEPSASATT